MANTAKDKHKTTPAKEVGMAKHRQTDQPPTMAILPPMKDLGKELDTHEQQHGGLPVSLVPLSRQPPSLCNLAADWGYSMNKGINHRMIK